MAEARADVVIVGAGLSGMIAALYLLEAGRRVVLVERRKTVGGLCGTFELDGYEFALACNDFGQGLVRMLRELRIPVRFECKQTLIAQPEREVVMPPTLGTLARLLPDAHGWWHLVRALRAAKRAPRCLESVVDSAFPPSCAADLAKLPAYLMGVAPADLSSEFFDYERQYAYGYTKPACPLGGPGVLAEALGRAIRERGGIIHLCTRALDIAERTEHGDFQVSTDRGSLHGSAVIDSSERYDTYPAFVKRGLPLSMMCLVVDDRLTYPKGVHTMVHLPRGVSAWFSALDRGEAPAEYGFHLFRSDLPRRGDYYTMNLFFYRPRGSAPMDEAERLRTEEHLLARLAPLLPGLSTHLRYTRILDEHDFAALHGLSSRVMPFVHPVSAPRAPSRDPRTRIFRAGHTVHPPGEHAGAAALSGRLVSEEVLAALAKVPDDSGYTTREPRKEATA